MPSHLLWVLPPSIGESIQITPERARKSDASTVGATTLLQSCSKLCWSGSELLDRELWTCDLAHIIFPFPLQDLPLYHSHPLPNKQLISMYHFLINPAFADFITLSWYLCYGSPVISNFDSNFVKLFPFLLSIVSCCFSFCCPVSGTTGQCRPSAYTLLPFVICSILQFLMSLSCQRHRKTEWAICMYILTHTCLYHLPLY